MKKILYCLFFVGVVCFTLSLTGCKPKLQDVRGFVKSVNVHGDTLLDMTVMNGKDSLVFSLDKARFTDGAAFTGDSVIVNYIDGREGKYRALVVTVLPKRSKVIELNKEDTTKKLLTAPAKNVKNRKLEY